MRDCANCFHRKPVLKEDGTWTAECEKWDCEFQSRENMVEKTEAKQGEWINEFDSLKCPFCGMAIDDEVHWLYSEEFDFNFCPNCGASMKAVHNETDN